MRQPNERFKDNSLYLAFHPEIFTIVQTSMKTLFSIISLVSAISSKPIELLITDVLCVLFRTKKIKREDSFNNKAISIKCQPTNNSLENIDDKDR